MLCKKGPIPGNEFAWTDRHGWPDDLPGIIYIDHFGNLMTGIRAGQLDPTESLRLKGTLINAAGFFSEVEKGQLFWYENSHGLVEIAVNQGSARDKLSASLGDRIE
jgi:hypothetical protein